MLTLHRRFKDAIYGQFARVGKAIAAPRPLELLDLLCQGPRTVEAFAEQAAISVANASQHLQVLRAARLVAAERKGLYMEYRLADDGVCRFLFALRGLAEARLAEVDQITREYFERRGAMEPVEGEELLRRVRAGAVTVLDVRPAEEYRAGHIPGALSIPVGELKARLKELPRDREIVAYCRGPYCVMAVEAVELLRKEGFRADRMERGVVDWRVRGCASRAQGHGADLQALLPLRHGLCGASPRLRHARQVRRRRSAGGRDRRLPRLRRVERHAHHARHRHARARRPPLRRPGARQEGRRRLLPAQVGERRAHLPASARRAGGRARQHAREGAPHAGPHAREHQPGGDRSAARQRAVVRAHG